MIHYRNNPLNDPDRKVEGREREEVNRGESDHKMKGAGKIFHLVYCVQKVLSIRDGNNRQKAKI